MCILHGRKQRPEKKRPIWRAHNRIVLLCGMRAMWVRRHTCYPPLEYNGEAKAKGLNRYHLGWGCMCVRAWVCFRLWDVLTLKCQTLFHTCWFWICLCRASALSFAKIASPSSCYYSNGLMLICKHLSRAPAMGLAMYDSASGARLAYNRNPIFILLRPAGVADAFGPVHFSAFGRPFLCVRLAAEGINACVGWHAILTDTQLCDGTFFFSAVCMAYTTQRSYCRARRNKPWHEINGQATEREKDISGWCWRAAGSDFTVTHCWLVATQINISIFLLSDTAVTKS